MKNVWKFAFAPAMLLAACTSNAEVNTANATQAIDGDNGLSVNGISVNGISVNGISVNGISVNGISVNGISVNGTAVNGISVNGISVNGIDFVGAHMFAQMTNGDSLELRVDDIAPLAEIG